MEQQNSLPASNIMGDNNLYSDVCRIIEGSRQWLAISVNAEICVMHWQIGKRIKEEVLDNKRAEYGKQVLALADEHQR